MGSRLTRGTRVLLTIAAIVGCVVVGGVATAVYALVSWEPVPSGDGNPDPRAAEDSDPRISFDQASRDLSFRLPDSASRLRYAARHDSRPYVLQFSFVTSCSSMAEFPDENDLVQSRSGEPAGLRRVADDLGTPLPRGSATVWTDGDDNDLLNRAAVSVPLNGHDCRIVGQFQDFR